MRPHFVYPSRSGTFPILLELQQRARFRICGSFPSVSFALYDAETLVDTRLTSVHPHTCRHSLTHDRRVLGSPLAETINEIALCAQKGYQSRTILLQARARSFAYVDTVPRLIPVGQDQLAFRRPRYMSDVIPPFNERGGNPVLRRTTMRTRTRTKTNRI